MFVSDREVLRMNFIRTSEENEAPLLLSEVSHPPLPRQVVTLAFLSGQISASHISEQLARSLCTETDSSVVLVRLQPQHGIGSTNGEARPEFFLNGEFHMPPEVRQTDGGFHSITVGLRSEPPTPAGIASLVDQLSRHFRYVLIEALDNKSPAPWFSELLLRSNLAYLFLKPTTEDLDHLDRVMREARTRCRNGGVHVKPVACLSQGERSDGLDLLAQRAANPVHMFIHGYSTLELMKSAGLQSNLTGLFRADIRRLAREIGGCLVGLALSSGAAKGFAHIGVIQVLEANGIEVDVIAGASMGAYVGSLWAYGCDGRELERLARELESRWALWTLIDPAFPPRRGFIRGFAVKKRLMRTIGDVHFANLMRPLRIVAANLATLERQVFSSGEVAAAVHASTAVPGICVPITIDGEIYADGGIVDPLPVDVLREMGVAKVIAVNVIPTSERIRRGIESELEQARQNETKGRGLFSKIFPVNRQVNYFARGNVLEILMRSLHGAQIRMAEASCQMADLVLRPDIFDDRWLDYRSPGRFITLGREAAERHLEEIKSLVARKEIIHERKLAPESVAAAI
jgi:NTE family protein